MFGFVEGYQKYGRQGSPIYFKKQSSLRFSSFPSNIHNIRNKTLQTRVSLVSYAELQWANLFLELASATAKLSKGREFIENVPVKNAQTRGKIFLNQSVLQFCCDSNEFCYRICYSIHRTTLCACVRVCVSVSVNIFKHTLHLEDRAIQNSG